MLRFGHSVQVIRTYFTLLTYVHSVHTVHTVHIIHAVHILHNVLTAQYVHSAYTLHRIHTLHNSYCHTVHVCFHTYIYCTYCAFISIPRYVPQLYFSGLYTSLTCICFLFLFDGGNMRWIFVYGCVTRNGSVIRISDGGMWIHTDAYGWYYPPVPPP